MRPWYSWGGVLGALSLFSFTHTIAYVVLGWVSSYGSCIRARAMATNAKRAAVDSFVLDWRGGGGALILPELLSDDGRNTSPTPLRLCCPALLFCQHASVHGTLSAVRANSARETHLMQLQGMSASGSVSEHDPERYPCGRSGN
jgi:hypothetical protein